MVKCTECRFYEPWTAKYGKCHALSDIDIEWIECEIAGDDNLPCDLYVKKLDDNETEESSA